MTKKYANTLSSVIREELRALVVQSRPGTRLPSENALVNKYHVARMTAGKAIRELEKEGLVERKHGCGTFVKGKRIITLLLPCPDFLDERYNPYNNHYTAYLQGALQAVAERNLGLEMIPVSLTNNCSDINYSLLANLNSGSMVICTIWFRMLYDFLTSRNVRVVLLCRQHEFYGFRQYHQFFYTIDADRQSAITKILDFHHRRGKQRIALAGGYLDKKDHPLRTTYLEWCKFHQTPELLYAIPELAAESSVHPKEVLAKLYRRDAFDAIIIHHIGFRNAHGTIQEMLDLPQEVDVFGFDFDFRNSPDLVPFPSCCPNSRQMAYDAVVALDEKKPIGSVQKIPYEFQYVPSDWHDSPVSLKENNLFPNHNYKTKE